METSSCSSSTDMAGLFLKRSGPKFTVFSYSFCVQGLSQGVIGKLTGGLAKMAKMRKFSVLRGYDQFVASHHLSVEARPEGFKVTFAVAE